MALDTTDKRLKWARERHGKYNSPTDAARGFGWTVSTYLGHENGDRVPSRDAAKRYGKAYGIRWEWLLEGEGEPRSAVRAAVINYVPLLSIVTAGKLTDRQSQIPVEDVPLLAFADLGRGEFFALKVEGDSMDRVSPEGSVIVVNRAERELIAGRCYIFALRGETTFKRWHPEPDRLAPFSTNPAHEPIFIKRQKDFDVIGRVRRTVLDL